MSRPIHRRHFLGTAAALAAGATLQAAWPANDKIVLAMVGTGGRGTDLSKMLAKVSNVEIAYTCDADQKRADTASEEVAKLTSKAPRAVQDFRKVLDDKAVDAIVVATPNHWHAPAAILGCAAGKHVYVEKPCSYNPREGELLVEAARKNDRRVQMGNQRRSWPNVMEAIEEVRGGAIGRAYFAQAWYVNNRGSIGKGVSAPVPMGLDYDLWQGPAPRRPFKSNYLHYNWHWFWHWGNGELGNNGIHMIDLCRWGLGVDYPVQVTSIGGRYRWSDDQETPDLNIVSYTFGDRKMITWEGRSCNRMPDDKQPDVLFQGEKGSLALFGGNYTVYDAKGKEIRKKAGQGSELVHMTNFLDAVRGKTKLNSEIEEGHKSTLLCHLGNIAYRTGRELHCDPKTGRIIDDQAAMAFWSREYEKGWEPKGS